MLESKKCSVEEWLKRMREGDSRVLEFVATQSHMLPMSSEPRRFLNPLEWEGPGDILVPEYHRGDPESRLDCTRAEIRKITIGP